MRTDAPESQVKLALLRAIKSSFSKSDWMEIALVTGTEDEIVRHPRLLRSLDFGDDDYGACVAEILDVLLGASPPPPWASSTLSIYERFPRLREVEDFMDLSAWLRDNDPELYKKLYGPEVGDDSAARAAILRAQESSIKTPRTPETPLFPPTIEVLERENLVADQAGKTTERKSRKVFLVHGRDRDARRDMVNLLHAFDLRVVDWGEARAATGKPNPYTLDIVAKGLELANAVVVLLTPDDIGYVRRSFEEDRDGTHETSPTGQPRLNVIFEAGLALGRAPDRVVLVELGTVRSMSDIAGVNVIRLRNAGTSRREFGRRLEAAGLEVDMENDAWMSVGSFDRPAVSDSDFR